MPQSQTTRLDLLTHLSEDELLFKGIIEISDEAIFIINLEKFVIADCNQAALKLFEAESKNELVDLAINRLYNHEPLNLGNHRLKDELVNNSNYSHELSFKTRKQNVFWGRMTQKTLPFSHPDYALIKIAKSANYLREEDWLGEVLRVTSKVTGRQFFKELTKFLCHTFNAKAAFIARRVAENDSQLKVFYWYGEDIKTYFITIKDSVIENILRGYTSFYPQALEKLFPNDSLVKETSARSFIGAPVFDISGQSFGVIGVLSQDSMEELPNSRYMLSILSSRAASEIQRIRSKELLRQQTRELAEINLMKDKLISVITTDLHAPLSTILGYSEMLRNKSHQYSAAEMAVKMKAMDSTLRNLYVFLENLADWNNLQQNEIRCRLSTNNLANIFSDTKPYYDYLAGVKRVALQNKVPSAMNIMADSNLVRIAIRNIAVYLIKNTMHKASVIFDARVQDGKWFVVLQSDNFTAEPEDVEFCLNARPQELYNASKASSVPVLGLFIAREFIALQGSQLNYRFDKNKLEIYFEIHKSL